jgi:hypothetical protein
VGAPPEETKRWPERPFHGLRYAPLPLSQRDALRVRGDRELSARDALPSRVYLLRGALRLPCGVVPRARDVPLP